MGHEKSAEEIQGFEYDWIASDAKGFVALFSTAGGGYAPPAFLRDTEGHDAAIDVILALPATTQPRFAPTLPMHLQNTWQQVAERGLFAFDADPHGGAYRQVAAPVSPIHVDDLPPFARDVARALCLPHVEFDGHSIISTPLVVTAEL